MRFGPWVLVAAALLWGCGPDTTLSPPVLAELFTRAPSITPPQGDAPLTRVITFQTSTPAHAVLDIVGGGRSRRVRFPGFHTDHSLPVLGLRPETAYEFRLLIDYPDGTTVADAGVLHALTNALPVDFPRIDVLVSDPARMEPGYTLLDFVMRQGDVPQQVWTAILDETGAVVWYSRRGGRGARMQDDGTLAYHTARAIIEMDMLGNRVSYVVPGPEALTHDLFRTVGGTWLTLSAKDVAVAEYPTSLTDPNAPRSPASIRTAPVIEVSAAGAIVGTWDPAELIDTGRVGFNSLSLSETGDSFDWAHLNAVLEDPRDQSILFSARHQDAVVNFRRDGSIKWILAPHANWSTRFQPFLLTPVGAPFEWSFHQHAPTITGDGTVLLFDNGNNRASPFDGTHRMPAAQSYSRAVEYLVDEQRMEIRQLWDSTGAIGENIYAAAQGGAQWLPATDNVLVTFGSVAYTGGISSRDLGRGAAHARVIEVTRGLDAARVLDIVISAGAVDAVTGVYRSIRIPSLYAASIEEQWHATD